jgi:hypothetical protein
VASEFSIRALNDWRAAVHIDLATALQVSRDVFHRTAAQATKHAIILMGQSARALTKQAKARRPIEHEKGKAPFVTVYTQRGNYRVHKWQAEQRGADGWERVRRIGRRGLAKRSWMWGLSQIKGDVEGFAGAGAAGRPIPGVTRTYEVKSGRDTVGHVMENRLGYLERILPGGWLATVEQKAVNLIMKRAEMKMVQDFAREIGKRAVFTRDAKAASASTASATAIQSSTASAPQAPPTTLAEAARRASSWNEYQSITAGRFGADRRAAAAAWREAKGK